MSKSFGEVHALQSLDLRVPQNSIFAFLGPNGAGKTTTIKLLLGRFDHELSHSLAEAKKEYKAIIRQIIAAVQAGTGLGDIRRSCGAGNLLELHRLHYIGREALYPPEYQQITN